MIQLRFKLWLELFDRSSGKPLTGTWKPPLQSPPINRQYKYVFNLDSDPTKDCRGQPCFWVNFYENYDGVYTVTFGHAETKFQDRSTINKQIHQQTGTDPGIEMMGTVMRVMEEFVNQKQPVGFSWTGVKKSTPGAINTDARAKVYDLWARKTLAGKYTKYQGIWLRNDVYEKERTKPPTPPDHLTPLEWPDDEEI